MQATHIFDGLESWPSHVMYVSSGELQTFERAENLPELQQGKLLELVERWLRQDQLERRNEAKEKLILEYSKDSSNASTMEAASWNNGWTAGRLTSSMKLSSNAVMRM
jgi:CCR4-NOT complex subunit CAF16